MFPPGHILVLQARAYAFSGQLTKCSMFNTSYPKLYIYIIVIQPLSVVFPLVITQKTHSRMFTKAFRVKSNTVIKGSDRFVTEQNSASGLAKAAEWFDLIRLTGHCVGALLREGNYGLCAVWSRLYSLKGCYLGFATSVVSDTFLICSASVVFYWRIYMYLLHVKTYLHKHFNHTSHTVFSLRPTKEIIQLHASR